MAFMHPLRRSNRRRRHRRHSNSNSSSRQMRLCFLSCQASRYRRRRRPRRPPAQAARATRRCPRRRRQPEAAPRPPPRRRRDRGAAVPGTPSISMAGGSPQCILLSSQSQRHRFSLAEKACRRVCLLKKAHSHDRVKWLALGRRALIVVNARAKRIICTMCEIRAHITVLY